MNTKQPALDVMVGEQYTYCRHVYVVVGIYEDSVALASTRPPCEVCIKTIERLQQAAHQGRFTLSQAAPVPGRKNHIVAALNAAERAKLTCRLANKEPVIKGFSGFLPRDAATALFEKVSRTTNNSKALYYEPVRNWLNRELDGDGAASSFMPFTKRAQNQWDRLPEVVRATIERCLVRYFYIPEPGCLSDVIDSIVASLEEYNRSRPATDKIKIPSRSTLRRRIGERSEARRLLTQKVRAAAAKAFASNPKHRRWYRLLEHIEGDPHVLDLELGDDQGKPIGKAALTILLDVGSRTVTGWDISVSPASALKPLRALKPSLSKHGVGKNYVSDNGPENTERDKLGTAFAFRGPHITYCKVRYRNYKLCVKRWFKSLTTGWVCGTTSATQKAFGEYPWQKLRYILPVGPRRSEYWLEHGYRQPPCAPFRIAPSKLARSRQWLSCCRRRRAKR